MKKYQCHKVVEAAQITAVEITGEHAARVGAGQYIFELTFGAKAPVVGDYVVRYADGYVSWSPAQPFEEGYTPLAE